METPYDMANMQKMSRRCITDGSMFLVASESEVDNYYRELGAEKQINHKTADYND